MEKSKFESEAVRNGKYFLYFSSKTYIVGSFEHPKEPSQWDGSFEHPKHMFKLIGKKVIAILRWKILLNWPYGEGFKSVLHVLKIIGRT